MRFLLIVGCCCVVFLVSESPAQDKPIEPSTEHILEIAKSAVAEINGFELIDDKEVELKHVGPVLTFGEAGFKIASGTLWMWTREGSSRPAAIFSLATIDTRRFYEFHSFSGNKLRFQILGNRWRPDSAWKPLKLPDAAPPAESAPRRLSQMKLLTERFRSNERVIPGDQIVEMRILPTPIYRYPNPTKENDGAVFVISRDGDPEAILILETTTTGWQYMATRLSGHVPTIYLDETKHELNYAMGPTEPYFYTFRKAETKESPIQR